MRPKLAAWRDETPYYADVPLDPRRNAVYRLAVWDECRTKSGARDVFEIASRDILWCLATLGWTYDPRLDDPHLPWIPYDYQEEDVLKLQAAVGNYPLASQKSRCTGWTWMCLYVLWHPYIFGPGHDFLVASRNQDLVDKTGSKKSLLSKFDYLTDHLPPRLRPGDMRILMMRENPRNGASVGGASTTQNIARGERYRAVIIDEFASYEIGMGFLVLRALESVTKCCIYNSTHKGEGTAFHTCCINPGIRTITTLWTDHPIYTKGLYTVENGRFVALDTSYDWPVDEHGERYCYKVEHDNGDTHIQYPVLDGIKNVRSPWYDYEAIVMLNGDEAAIAEELDCNVAGSAYQMFGSVPREHKAKYAKPPISTPLLTEVLDLKGQPQLVDLLDSRDVRLSLWIELAANAQPAGNFRYILGSDIGAGEGASDSTHVIWNHDTGEKVAEVKTAWLTPAQHARVGVVLCRWFHDAYHIWDATGPPGSLYGREVLDEGYANIFFRYTNDHKQNRKPTDQPGFMFAGGAAIKGYVMGKYKEALREARMINYSAEALDECGRIYLERTPTGTRIVHAKERAAKDPRGAGENHADLCIADTLVCRAREELGRRAMEMTEQPIGPQIGSVMWMRGLRKQQLAESDKWAS